MAALIHGETELQSDFSSLGSLLKNGSGNIISTTFQFGGVQKHNSILVTTKSSSLNLDKEDEESNDHKIFHQISIPMHSTGHINFVSGVSKEKGH